MPLLRSINEYGIHVPFDIVITKGEAELVILDPSNNVKGLMEASNASVTITPTLAPEFQPE